MRNITFEIVTRDQYVMSAHDIHTEIEMYYLTRGERLYFVENRTYHLSAGSALFISSGRIHKTSSIGNQSHERMLLEIHPHFLTDCNKQFRDVNFDYLLNQTAVIIAPGSPYSCVIRFLFDEIRQLTHDKPYGYEAEINCDVFKLFINFQRSISSSADERIIYNPKHQKIYEVAEYMSGHMASIPNLDSLCAQFFISKYYLSHSFKAVTGLSVMAFLNIARVQRARVLLSETNLSIAQIAKMVGLETQAHFTDVFKRIEGVTPHEYKSRPDKHPWRRDSQPEAVKPE